MWLFCFSGHMVVQVNSVQLRADSVRYHTAVLLLLSQDTFHACQTYVIHCKISIFHKLCSAQLSFVSWVPSAWGVLLDSFDSAYVVVQFFPLVQFFLNWYRIHWTGTIVIVLIYFYQLSKKGIFLFWGVVKKSISSYPIPLQHTMLKNFLFTHLNLNLNSYLWICCPLSYPLDNTSSSYQLAMIIYN